MESEKTKVKIVPPGEQSNYFRHQFFKKSRKKSKNKNQLIDLVAWPYVPEDLILIEHGIPGILSNQRAYQESFLWPWNPKIFLYQFKEEKKKSIGGFNFLGEAVLRAALNANVLDFLLKCRWLIPKHWKKFRAIYFPGTVYADGDGNFLIRGLKWDKKKLHWKSTSKQLKKYFLSDEAVALSTEISKKRKGELSFSFVN